jgi:uncharacterized protein involved in exopolysaccharide biosynthesis
MQPPAEDNARRNTVADDEVNLFDMLLVLVRRLKLIVAICAVTFVLACIITLLMPNIYTATTRILPPVEDQGRLSGMPNNLGGLPSLLGVTGGGSSAELYVGMLQSRTVADAIIDGFGLMELYQSKTRAGAYDTLVKSINIELGKKDGIITLSVDDPEPIQATAIANAFIDELKRLNVALNLGSASRERSFLAERLEAARKELESAEERLREFQEQHQTIRINEQATALIEAIANLRAELASREVRLGVLLTRQTERNFEVRAVREEILRIREQIQRLEKTVDGQTADGGLFLPTSEIPALGVEYARLLREFKVQETLFELLTKQYEMTRINEAKEVSSLQVLDEAAVPDRKSRPRRTLLVLGATAVAFVLSIFLAFALEYQVRMAEEDRRRWREIRAQLPFGGRSRWAGKSRTGS